MKIWDMQQEYGFRKTLPYSEIHKKSTRKYKKT